MSWPLPSVAGGSSLTILCRDMNDYTDTTDRQPAREHERNSSRRKCQQKLMSEIHSERAYVCNTLSCILWLLKSILWKKLVMPSQAGSSLLSEQTAQPVS
jgi:hypothetical protein